MPPALLYVTPRRTRSRRLPGLFTNEAALTPAATTITRGGPELAYMRVVSAIADRIESGELRAGDKLPAERDIAQEFGVAYQTARRAAEVLRERGLIGTVHGKRTFVR